MRGRAPWAAGFLLLFGILAIVEARKLTIGELGRPGPGFFPFYLAVALAIVSLVLLVQSLHQATGEQRPFQEPGESLRRGKIAWTLFGLFLYAFALEPLGFLLPTFILMLFFFRAVDPLRWTAAISGALATSALTYVIFKLWLQIPFPAGPWGL